MARFLATPSLLSLVAKSLYHNSVGICLSEGISSSLYQARSPLEQKALRLRYALLHVLTAGTVQRFGRLHDDPIRARQRQASETRQGTKSRAVVYGASRGSRADLVSDAARSPPIEAHAMRAWHGS